MAHRPFSARRVAIFAAIFLAGLFAALALRLSPADAIPSDAGLELAWRFFSSAVSPAWTPEGEVPESTPPIVLTALSGAWGTLKFALTAMSLAMVLGLILGILASTSWWEGLLIGSRSGPGLRSLMRATHVGTRTLIALMRSVHELMWAVLFLGAFGLGGFTAIAAITIPYAGTLAKVFSDMIDEMPRDSAAALRTLGAGEVSTFLVGVLPRAMPDLWAYSLYRFECAIRSSAILGFFGFPTLGLYIKLSFENTYYGEVWTYLYTLFLMVFIVDWWSGGLRRRLGA